MQNNDEFDEMELQLLLDKAKALPRDVPPAPEAWGNIRDRIEGSRVRSLVPQTAVSVESPTQPSSTTPDLRFAASGRARVRQTRLALAVAAVLFITVTTVVVLREDAIETRGDPIAVVPQPSSNGTAVTASTSITAVFAQYDEATSDLTKELDQRRARLQPEAVAVLDSCLTTIDRAIKESRSALAEAPDNATIAELLQVTYQQKLDLLRRATELPLGSL